MDKINAPYNFVPLAKQVVYPDWAEQVSHDIPLEKGLCGEIIFCIEAKSPLLVGGEQTKANTDDPGEVKFFRTPDGNYAIPGASLRGMVRNVLEIATFSRMQMVDDKRYGLRDISGKHVKSSYTARVRGHLKFGLMKLGKEGSPEITPCEMARFSHRDLEGWWKQCKPIFSKGMTVSEKYELWQALCEENDLEPYSLSVTIGANNSATSITQGGYTGAFPVLTGQISDYRDSSGKFRDFIFHSYQPENAFFLHEVDAAAWRDFLFIHGDKETAPSAMSWPGFWKERFWRGQPVPVFYLRSARRLQIGLAYMPKLAADFSIREMIDHSVEEKEKNKNKADFATLIFGTVGEKPADARKGRVQFSMGVLQGEGKAQEQPATILSAPSPSYFPNYICQKTNAKGVLSSTAMAEAQYATYIQTPAHAKPQLRGWKRYPVRPDSEVKVQQLVGDDQEKNKKIQVILHPLLAGVKFESRVVFHNLKAEELGALLWSLTFGANTDCRHSLGMGKSFGFGQVSLTLQDHKTEIIANNESEVPDCMACFVAYMSKELGTSWAHTLQIESLLAMADERQRDFFRAELQHMVLSRKPNRNDFHVAKTKGLALQTYALPGAVVAALPPGGWQNVVLHYAPGKQELLAREGIAQAFATGEEAVALWSVLSTAQKKRLKQRKLKANLTVASSGGNNWKILSLEVVV